MKRFISLIAIIVLSALATAALTTQDNNSPKTVRSASAGKQARKTTNQNDPRVLKVGPSTTYLNKGLTTDDVVRALGKPETISERMNGDTRVVLYTYPRSEGQFLIAEFENGLLARSYIDTPAYVAQADEAGK